MADKQEPQPNGQVKALGGVTVALDSFAGCEGLGHLGFSGVRERCSDFLHEARRPGANGPVNDSAPATPLRIQEPS
eukprot:3589054-Lingulodinium_polyedra.AAC.1